MTCQEFWETMPELEAGPHGAAAHHLRECQDCAAALQNQRTLAVGLRGMAGELARLKAPNRVERNLLAAFRSHSGVLAPAPTFRWWRPVATWASAAAVVFTAFLVFAVRGRQPQRVATAAAVESTAIDWTAGLPADDSQGGASGAFIPMPNADRLPQTNELNLVRVEVPRSAMIALGYSVTADRAQEMVRADVVMGSDGLARAVRFLDE